MMNKRAFIIKLVDRFIITLLIIFTIILVVKYI